MTKSKRKDYLGKAWQSKIADVAIKLSQAIEVAGEKSLLYKGFCEYIRNTESVNLGGKVSPTAPADMLAGVIVLRDFNTYLMPSSLHNHLTIFMNFVIDSIDISDVLNELKPDLEYIKDACMKQLTEGMAHYV